jgi:hypothetical protein
MSFDPGPPVLDWFSAARAFYGTAAGLSLSKQITAQSDFAGVSSTAGDHQLSGAVGTGAATKVNADGGKYTVTTGATAASAAGVTIGGWTIANPTLERWWMASQFQITSATDAQAELGVLGLDGGAGDRVELIGNNSVLTLRLIKGGTTTDLVTNWTVDTTVPHEFGLAFDLTTVRVFVDQVQVGAQSTLTNLPTAEGQLHTQLKNGTTAAARTGTVFSFIIGKKGPT